VNPVLLGISGQRYARNVGIPVIASFHTDLSGFAEKWGLGMFSEPIWGYLRWIHNQADLNVCPSHATADELTRQGFENVRVWPRGVDTEQYHPEHRSQEWRERLSSGQPDAPLLLYVGRLSVEKRIKWIRPVLDLLPEARLAIIGDGPERAELEEYFAGTPTVFPGFLRGHDLAQAYASADLFVFPAANETLGNVVLEAMASELPVVAAGSGGPLDLVADGETGILFDSEDPPALVEAVARLVEDRALADAPTPRPAPGRPPSTICWASTQRSSRRVPFLKWSNPTQNCRWEPVKYSIFMNLRRSPCRLKADR
jgi:glycosyltransferase involved in cell wall biosynthesis